MTNRRNVRRDARAKRYTGTLEHGDFVVRVNGAPLVPRFDLYNHSPDGFAWGYQGSGPAQLALALCADVLADDARAVFIYHDLMRAYVSTLPGSRSWFVWGDDLLDVIEAWEGVRHERVPRRSHAQLAKRFARG
jgi:hypothetical protein